MEFEGSYFFTQELEELHTAKPRMVLASPPLREPGFDDGEPVVGETLPEDVLRALRACLGF